MSATDRNLSIHNLGKNAALRASDGIWQVLAGAPIDCTDPLFSDWTPLHYAAWNGHAASCAMLLRLGAKPFPLDHADWTPWECALILEHEDVRRSPA